jgi:hypothetical protein
MITQTATTSFKAELLQGIHDFNTDTFKIALYLATADLGANTTVYGAAGETSGSGYTAGGETMTGISVNAAGYVNFANVSWNPAVFTARGALIYNSSKGNKAVAVLDFGSDKTATNTFLVQVPANTVSSALIRFS